MGVRFFWAPPSTSKFGGKESSPPTPPFEGPASTPKGAGPPSFKPVFGSRASCDSRWQAYVAFTGQADVRRIRRMGRIRRLRRITCCPPVVPFLTASFLGEASATKIDCRKWVPLFYALCWRTLLVLTAIYHETVVCLFPLGFNGKGFHWTYSSLPILPGGLSK